MTFKTCDFYGMLRLVIAVLIGPFMHGTSRLDAGPIVVVGDVQPASRLPVTEIGHTEWDRLLQRYVNGNGLVNYSAWKASSEDGLALDRYLANLSQSQWPPQNAMDVSTRSAVIAYWINAYNAVTIRGILKEYPTTSIRNHTSVLLGYNIWKDLRLAVDGRQVSLDQMEHEILRTMKEPRIHFAIVCASRGCPTLRRQAYNAVDLETQLAENARDFFARSRHFLFDPSTREFHLSAILNWFGGDFGADQATQLQAIAQWLSPGEAKRVAEQGGGRVKYRDYDWGLNDLRVMTIDHSITLDARQTYDELRIIASDIVVDGKGVVMRGSDHEDPSTFTGTAIAADGVSGVTLKGISAHGYETGLKVRNASTWTVDHCDFSRNFHDPKFGWGENGRRGGIVWENVERSVLRDCRATRVWDACVLVDSHDNRIERNDLSHTSNTGLKLWHASRNHIEANNISYGIRKDPGEVHARDSACVLMESGSNDNVLAHNDCTHGGDGIFVRVLNQWVSTGNRFEENDCSYANNNCIEAWSPRNLWIRNRANHGSYGFWLGASDQNVLIDNEASYNGQPDGNHNSPHLPNAGHAGIVFMFGPSSHTIVRGNRCEGNNGAGIAAIGDLESKGQRWQAFHWIIEQNQLRDNRWGVYLQYASMIDLAANTFERNAIADVARDLTVMEFVERSEASPQPTATRNAPPVLSLEGPSVVRVGESSLWTATARTERADATLHYRWLVPGSGEGNEPTWTHTFSEAGFYRLALTVDDGYLSDLAWRDLYVVDDGQEMATESPNDAQSWSVVESDSQAVFTMEQTGSLVGDRALHARIDPYSGGRVTLQWRTDAARRSLGETTHLVFWLKTRNEHVPSWQDVNPLVSISDGDGNTRRWRPVSDRLSAPVVNEAREGWMRMAIPLAGDADWIVEGSDVTSVNGLSIGFDSWGAPPLEITIDGLTFVKTPRAKHGT